MLSSIRSLFITDEERRVDKIREVENIAVMDSELEKYAYHHSGRNYFVRETRKSTWFTQCPVPLRNVTSLNRDNIHDALYGRDRPPPPPPSFNHPFNVQISRAGDYLLYTWLITQFSEVRLSEGYLKDCIIREVRPSIRWTPNLMHNLIKNCTITFNDLVAASFDNYILDFWSEFTTPLEKEQGYAKMCLASCEAGEKLPSRTGNLPLPFFFSRDSGVALPTAALPYNDMQINFEFRDWKELLIVEEVSLANGSSTFPQAREDMFVTIPTISKCEVWANYSIVSGDERKRMACAPRNIFIEQMYRIPVQEVYPEKNPTPSLDIRESGAVKAFFFGCRNKTIPAEWSNYSCLRMNNSVSRQNYQINSDNVYVEHVDQRLSPIERFTLVYEETQRLCAMGSDYFSMVSPWYTAPTIPRKIGYNVYSYSMDFYGLNPKGSTNYGKLTNVSVSPIMSEMAIACAGKYETAGIPEIWKNVEEKRKAGVHSPQKYEYVHILQCNNVIRVSGGALGFPINFSYDRESRISI